MVLWQPGVFCVEVECWIVRSEDCCQYAEDRGQAGAGGDIFNISSYPVMSSQLTSSLATLQILEFTIIPPPPPPPP